MRRVNRDVRPTPARAVPPRELENRPAAGSPARPGPGSTPAEAVGGRIRILIADDHGIFRDSLRKLLETQDDFLIVADAPDGTSAVRLAREIEPDVLLLDNSMPDMSGVEVLQQLNDAHCEVRTIVLTAALSRSDTRKVLELGARGIVLKHAATDQLLKCIRNVFLGEYWLGRQCILDLVAAAPNSASDASRKPPGVLLTPREREILALVVEGHRNKDIAETLSISEDTVKHHVTSIFDKTGVSNRLELALYAIHHQLAPSA